MLTQAETGKVYGTAGFTAKSLDDALSTNRHTHGGFRPGFHFLVTVNGRGRMCLQRVRTSRFSVQGSEGECHHVEFVRSVALTKSGAINRRFLRGTYLTDEQIDAFLDAERDYLAAGRPADFRWAS